MWSLYMWWNIQQLMLQIWQINRLCLQLLHHNDHNSWYHFAAVWVCSQTNSLNKHLIPIKHYWCWPWLSPWLLPWLGVLSIDNLFYLLIAQLSTGIISTVSDRRLNCHSEIYTASIWQMVITIIQCVQLLSSRCWRVNFPLQYLIGSRTAQSAM